MRKLLTQFLLLALLVAAPLRSQTTNGGITGVVTDSAGAVRPNVTVVLEGVDTGVRVVSITDTAGSYRFANVSPGRYRILIESVQTAAMPGQTSAPNQTVAPGQEIVIDTTETRVINLTTAAATSTTPTADAILLAEEIPVIMNTSQMAREFNGMYIYYLPQPNVFDRFGAGFGAYNLSFLTEAVTSAGIGPERGPAVGGRPAWANGWNVDGIDNNNRVIPGPLNYVSPEAVVTFPMRQNGFTPEYGHNTGGNYNNYQRTGTNEFHGSVYDFMTNRLLNATGAESARFGATESPRIDQNRIGGALGFPIWRNKMYGFGNFEYIPIGTRFFGNSQSFVPTFGGQTTLQNQLAVSQTNLSVLQQNSGIIGSPVATTTVNGAAIPLGPSDISQRAWRNRYIGTGAFDYTITEDDDLRFRYTQNSTQSNLPGAFLSPDPPMLGYTLLASGSYTRTFGAAGVNELRFGYNRWTTSSNPPEIDPGTTGFATFPGLTQFPNIIIPSENLSLGPAGGRFGLFQQTTYNTYNLSDNLSWNWRSHEFRIGGDGRRYIGRTGFPNDGTGTYVYSSLQRYLNDLPPDIASQRSFGNLNFDLASWLWFGYIQDQWTVRPNLQISMGLRYYYTSVPQGIRNQTSNTIANAGGLNFRAPKTDNNNLAPHVGFAWSPNWKRNIVFRGSFSMSYDQLAMFYLQSPIVAPQQGITTFGNLADNTPGFLANGGLQAPAGFNPNDPAQARAFTSTFYGNQQIPYSMEYNFSVQGKIWRNIVGEVRYLGQQGRHQPFYTLLNSNVTADRTLPLFTSAPSQATLDSLTLTLNDVQTPAGSLAAAGFTSPIRTVDFSGVSGYNALAVILSQRFASGFQLAANYTWSHLLDDGFNQPNNFGVGPRTQNTSLYDRRHKVGITGLWDMGSTFSKIGTYSWVRSMLADFTLAGTYVFESSQFLPAFGGFGAGSGQIVGGSIFNPAGLSGVGSGVTPLSNTAGNVVAYQVNNPGAGFIQTAPGLFAGKGPQNAFALDETNNFDFSATKGFAFRDRWRFEVRGDAFNVFNNTQFKLQQIQTAVTPGFNQGLGFFNPGSAGFGNSGAFLSSNSRLVQVALRLRW